MKPQKLVAAFPHTYVPLFCPCSAKKKSVLLPCFNEFLSHLDHLSALTYWLFKRGGSFNIQRLFSKQLGKTLRELPSHMHFTKSYTTNCGPELVTSTPIWCIFVWNFSQFIVQVRRDLKMSLSATELCIQTSFLDPMPNKASFRGDSCCLT